MLKKMLGMAAAAAFIGAAGLASAETPTYYPPHGKFVDHPDPYSPYYAPDECYFDAKPYFDYKAGYNVKFEKKVIKYFDPYTYKYVVLTIIKAKCKIGSYPSKKKIVYKGFGCDYIDKTDYYAGERTLYTYDSKFVIKKKDKYGTLTCKFKDYPDEEEPPMNGTPPV
jgi:hypothetical protein